MKAREAERLYEAQRKQSRPAKQHRDPGGGNPWVAALHAFIDEQEAAGPDRKLSDAAFRVWVHLTGTPTAGTRWA